ncbi:uncharacterized protein LOC124440403 [Xenia sp. Carnegie-2017]|uniref:uncharacterized protein LOC124440403 n=1 Tax=Xenia sp. Carnegie-2017 TaxID=2897299 RepID=UPI001F0362DD|nr:uncharacterized protein LOC124440403 [Xenia sp. Carnegie-2017]
MAGNNSVHNLKSVIHAIIQRDSDRARIKNKIDEALQEFNGKNQKLNYPNRAFIIRYNYAFKFWKTVKSDEFNKAGQIDFKRAEDLVSKLKKELNHCVLTDLTNDTEVDDPSFFKKTSKKRRQSQSNDSPVWLITCKCENAVYLKQFHGSNENEEKKVNRHDIFCGYCLISLGDEVEVDNDTGVMSIVRSKGLQFVEISAKAKFVENVLDKLNDESGFDVYTQFYDRYKGIWDYIKNDRELFESNSDHVNVFMKLCLSLCQKLEELKIQACEQFLLDISSSIFFIKFLPSIISNGGTRQYDGIKFFLKSMLKHNPQTARKVFKVAKPLAYAMHFARDDEMNGEVLVQSPGIEYLAELGEIVSSSVPGCQEVDTFNCSWEELPVIPTEREVFSEFDLNTLDAIKKDKPYDSSNQYLEINYRLLREECFRNLSTGIQKLSRNKSYDPRMMKLFRITLNTVEGGGHLVLECEDYNASDSSEEEESVCSDEMLHGSLMCISLSEKFDSLIWATVVKCEMKGKANTKLISVELCSERNGKTNIDVILQLIELATKGKFCQLEIFIALFNLSNQAMSCC